ncbi:MAG: fumarylacetoacetate hydrolase family protein [Magnetospirillum sp.]|nr:fumarylacetoacetate hydrolase family protein [Magnetospirillum sp.]
MDEARRQFLTIGAGLAAGALLSGSAGAAGPIPNSAAGSLRLITYSSGGRAPRVGVVRPSGRVVDLGAAAKARGMALSFDPASMVSLIAAGEFAVAQARQLMLEASDDGPNMADVRLLAPIPAPTRNVYAVGWNYLEHFKEGEAMRLKSAELPEHPVFFTKAVGTINGPYDPIPYDASVSTSIDWECELAVIIGKRGKNIAEADALKHVFGYCVINDTTARDIQQKKHGGQWFKGKSLDGHGPLGPWIIPASDLDYRKLHLITRVNGVVKQDASTEQMYFKVPRIIAELSAGLTLEPGDIIATGTPPGVGGARKPPEFLRPGDIMETEIVEIGLLRNVIGA